MTREYKKDMWIWTDHPVDVWRPARIIDITDKKLKVVFINGTIDYVLKRKNWTILSVGTFHEDVQNENLYKDLSKMSSLSTEAVLHCLRNAYNAEMFYTNLGSGTILAINPYRDVDGLFSDEKVETYHSASLSELGEMPAHVFTVAERALRCMAHDMNCANQSIIISGESGAGKTWTVRCLMRYLAVVGMEAATSILDSSDSNHDKAAKLSDSFVGDQIEHRILNSNPILEAFGNAATPRNHNSSRFGKYIQLQYDRSGSLVGAKLQVYLLEKTRVSNHCDFERPYHIFSQMVHGSSSAEKEEWSLPDEFFREDNGVTNSNMNNNLIIGNSKTPYFTTRGEANEADEIKEADKMDNQSAFFKTRNAMSSVGILTAVQSSIFKILSAILHLEKMNFEGTDDLSTPCTLTSSCQTNVKHAASLLAVPINSLIQAVTIREIQAGKSADRRRSVFKRSCTRDECSSRRDALMKYLYEQIFLWLVKHIGNDLAAPNDAACSFIGLLDVYGFESFRQNGLEQLCINYANEKLQQYYINNFLKLQQEELAAEGVNWDGLDISKRSGCLDVLESPHNSLFALLNEECRLNRVSNPTQLNDRISEKFSDNSFLTKPRISTDTPHFCVHHYAGTVLYETDTLISKNKDELPLEISNLLVNSSSSFVLQLISERVNTLLSKHVGARGKCHETVLTVFKKSLDDLLATLSTTNCHYIRCIKPNKHSKPSQFDSFHVLDQLRSSGVVETIQICGHLHPHRFTYSYFISHFRFFLSRKQIKPGLSKRSKSLYGSSTKHRDMQAKCDKILSIAVLSNPRLEKSKSWKFGKSFVFVSSAMYESLEEERSAETARCATKIQLAWLTSCHRKRCRELRRVMIEERDRAASIMQTAWRLKLHTRKCARARKLEIRLRNKAARVLQKAWKAYVERREKFTYDIFFDADDSLLSNDSHADMTFLQVRRIHTHFAELQKITSRKSSSKSHRTHSESSISSPLSFPWICRSKPSFVERYFPSLTIMSMCRLCSHYKRPLDIVRFNYAKFDNDLPCQTDLNDSICSDFSILSGSKRVDGRLLSPRSFDFYELNSTLSPKRTCILPYSDVAPRCSVLQRNF